jgi:hypothetical protein
MLVSLHAYIEVLHGQKNIKISEDITASEARQVSANYELEGLNVEFAWTCISAEVPAVGKTESSSDVLSAFFIHPLQV